MKIKTIDIYDEEKGWVFSDYVARKVDGADCERGKLEALSGTVDNLVGSFGRLMEVLLSKGTIEPYQVPMILDDYGVTMEILPDDADLEVF